jgi:hypothetical protein
MARRLLQDPPAGDEPLGRRFGVPASADVAREFRELADRWREETDVYSSPTSLFMHPDYQRIIGLGPSAVPLILDELERNGGLWFWALCAITGEDPVPDDEAGNVVRMTERWLEWGRARELV